MQCESEHVGYDTAQSSLFGEFPPYLWDNWDIRSATNV